MNVHMIYQGLNSSSGFWLVLFCCCFFNLTRLVLFLDFVPLFSILVQVV